MRNFQYFQPTEIRFGAGRLDEVGESVARLGRRCLIVTVPAFPGFELVVQRVKTSLTASAVAFAHFDGVIPNPTTAVVSAGASQAQDFGADVVLGVGGGSSLDTAKAVAVEARHPGTSWDYLFFRDRQPTEQTLPIVAVTTTSGTGSHVTQVAVVTNPDERSKSALYHPRLFPKISLVDPELVLTAPARVTAATGFDVFAHAFESFINPGGSAYTDLLASEALKIVASSLPAAVRSGHDLGARTAMAWADTLAGLAIANAGVTLPHGISMAVGGLYPHVAHGEALASVYPAILRYSWDAAPGKFAATARLFDRSLVGIEDAAAAEALSGAVMAFLRTIGLRIGLEDLKIPEGELKALAREALVLPDYKSHPRVACAEDVFSVLRESLRCEGETKS
ncbi:MAG: iron-containing alcohol dehydrogenase [Candidatus Aminicenantes bacterium]|nr:iron-containing alcohol dehydrogenase [Candidatus Aminicenantes bacterium]